VRRLVLTGAVLAALAPAVATATTSPESPTSPTEPTSAAVTTVVAPTPPSSDTLATEEQPQRTLVYDDSGNPVASIEFRGAQSGWDAYEEGNEPDPGNEYVRAMVSVESLITEGTFHVGVGDFILQSNNGFLTDAETVRSAVEAENDEELTDEADLANGESLDLTLVFQVVSSVGPQSIFYTNDDDNLVDVGDVTAPEGS
jgi:hypothetical protein